MYRRNEGNHQALRLKSVPLPAELSFRRDESLIRSAVACAALILFALLAQAHEDVIHHRPHAAESRKPHEAESRRPHAAASHPKPKKPPKRETAHNNAKPHKAAKH
jgi:hypothetical protein